MDISNKNEGYYPIILIPKLIEEGILKNITQDDIYKYLDIKETPFKYKSKPSFPNKYIYTTTERTELALADGCMQSISTIIMGVFFLIIFFMSLKDPSFVSLIMMVAGIFMIYISLKSKIVKETKETKISETEFNDLVNSYNKECELIKRENELLEKNYQENISKNNAYISNNLIQIKNEIYFKKLKPVNSVTKNKENIKRGKSELMFLNYLFEKFDNQIKVDVFLNSYQPDFTFICKTTGLHIDIEIDEPYSFIEKEPIHYIDSNDYDRNKFFLEQNWCVIRFSEKQITQEPENCVNLIVNFVENIKMKNNDFLFELKPDKMWTYEEALVKVYNNYRNSY